MRNRMIFQLTSNHEQLVLEDERVIIMAKRTLLEKILILLSGIAVTCCIILVGIIVTSYYKSSDKICNSESCVLSAADIIAALDESVDPCSDFFKFACGRWIKTNAIPDDDSSYDQFSYLSDVIENALHGILQEPISNEDPLPINQAKTFYKSCLNETLLDQVGLKPLLEYIDRYGGWPLVNRWKRERFVWQDLVADSRNKLERGYILRIFVTADRKDTKVNALYIDQTSLGMPRSVLVSNGSYTERINAYKTLMETIANVIASSLGMSLNKQNLARDVEEVLKFERDLANITTKNEERRDITRMHNAMTVEELHYLTNGSGIVWKKLLNQAFSSTNVTITNDTKVVVQEVEYLKKLSELIQKTDIRIVSNYLIWRLVKDLGDETTSEMRHAFFKYNKVSFGIAAQKSRKKECVSKSNYYLGMAIGQKYIENFFSNEAKTATNEMVENIRASFEDLLKNNSWMEEEIKPLAIEKARYISKKIGYPDWYNASGRLEKHFSELRGIEEGDHFKNMLTLCAYRSIDELEEFGKPSNRHKWYSAPTYANAYYWPSYNSIIFPGGILQPPFFRPNTLKAINYGAIGQVIGHEITHGFDDEGRQYDKLGNAIQWWSNATIDAFQKQSQCVINQYNSYRVPEIDKYKANATINGINTQGENMADNGGLRQAFMAYQKYVQKNGEEPRLPGISKYTPEQLFFISNANIWCAKSTKEGLLDQVLTDPHSPAKYRVIGSMSNMKEFAETWKCKGGSPMNPGNKCVLW